MTGAAITLKTTGSLRVNENVLASGAVALGAGSSLTLPAGVTVQSTSAALTFSSDGAANPSVIDISGAIHGTNASIQVTNHGSNVSVQLNQLPIIPVTVNGNATAGTPGTNNSLFVPGTAGNDTFNISGSANPTVGGMITLVGVETVTYLNLQALAIDSRAGNDVFNVNATSATTSLTGSGSDRLNLTANGSTNAPVIFQGGAGTNPVFVTGNTTANDIIVAAPNTVVLGSGLPDSSSSSSGALAGDVIGAGLQLQYGSNGSSISALNITLPGVGARLFVLGTQAPTTVQANGANDTVSLGGAPAPIAIFAGGPATFTAVRTMGSTSIASTTFNKPIVVTGTANAGDALIFDDSQNSSAILGGMNANSVSNIGEDPTKVTFQFTGIHLLTVNLGTGDDQFAVNSTFTDATGIVTINGGGGNDTVTVLASATPLAIDGGTGTTNKVVFDDSTGIAPITAAALGDALVGGVLESSLTGFGPVGTVIFTNFQQATLKESTANDTLSVNSSVTTLAVQAFGNGGDDTFNVSNVGQAMSLQGGAGEDTVKLTILDNPFNHPDLSSKLAFAVEHLVVDNTANTGAVSWREDNGDTVGSVQGSTYKPLVAVNGADDVRILAGTSTGNALNIVGDASPVTGTIDGDKVVLVTGQNVLASGNFKTYNDFSNTNGLIQFAALTGSPTSYNEDGFTLSGFNGSTHTALAADTSITSAVKAGGNTNSFVLTATDGGLFSLYGISMSGTGTVTFTANYDNGQPAFTKQIPLSASGGFLTFPFTSEFTALKSVQWNNVTGLLVTNIVATETVTPGGTATAIAAAPGGSLTAAAETINIDSNLGTLTINGVDSGATPAGAIGHLNGTPFFVRETATGTQYFFQGDLNIPNNSTVSAVGVNAGSFTISLIVGGDLNLGSNVSFNMSASFSTPGPGGGFGGGTVGTGGAGGPGGDGAGVNNKFGANGTGGTTPSHDGGRGGDGGIGGFVLWELMVLMGLREAKGATVSAAAAAVAPAAAVPRAELGVLKQLTWDQLPLDRLVGWEEPAAPAARAGPAPLLTAAAAVVAGQVVTAEPASRAVAGLVPPVPIAPTAARPVASPIAAAS